MKLEDARSVDELTLMLDQGLRPKYVFFWGHTPKLPGQTDHSCFSNWFPANFMVDGIEYLNTEQHMMAEKARLFGDETIREQILQSKSPGSVKSLGRKVSGFDDEIWQKHRFEIVITGNYAKFAQNQEMGEYLLHTGSKVLVEASPVDRIWGIGMGKDHKHAENPSLWNGLNLLGFVLMEVRHRLSKSI